MPPPSNFPNFKDLANKVAEGVLTLADGQPIDQFLGQLHDLKIHVHERVRNILTDPDSKPNSLHFDLLRLFGSPETLRLVTTNFDLHFTTASTEVFDGAPCELHYAPGLPLGHAFSGVVYLHGGVNKPPERLVLTDSDFGRAYLTEGWARLFLQRVFETYTVLFVGYSHNDPVMNYLARGFTPEMGKSRRFALVPAGSEEQWTYRRVIPVAYRSTTEENPHSLLPLALSGWAKQARLAPLEKEEKIRSIVALPPPIDPEIGDFIVDALSEASTTRFFTRHTNSVSWMKWTEERKLLKHLFDPSATITDVDAELGWWLADKFLCEHAGETLSLIRRQRQQLHPYTWTTMARKLSRDWEEETNRAAMHRCVTVLLSLYRVGTSCEALEYLAAKFTFPEDIDVALLVFEFLVRPVIRLDHDLFAELDEVAPEENVTFELESTGGGFWLDRLWLKFFKPNLQTLSRTLEPMIEAQLQLAYFLSHTDKGIEGAWDTLSMSRNLIEQSDHGRLRGGLGVLIDAAYDVVEWNVNNQPGRCDALIELWFHADSFILKRLAILAVALSSNWTGDRKLSWLLENDLIYSIGFTHEVFAVLKGAYPNSSESLRRTTIERAKRGRISVPDGAEQAAKYEKYNLIYWLHQSDPNCPIARAAFSEIQAANPEFGTREHPDLSVEYGPMQMGLRSPLKVDELLSKPPNEHIDFLLSYEEKRPFGPSREGLIENVCVAATSNNQWGWELAKELKRLDALKIDLWSSLVRSWSGSELQNDKWKEVLTLLDTSEQLHAPLANEITYLLEDGIKKTSQPIPSECFYLIDDLSKRLWEVVRLQSSAPKSTSKEIDWVSRAINHPAGRITLFWLSWLARQRREAGTSWNGIPTGVRTTLESLLIDDSYAAELGRVLLASQLNLLFSIDESWTKSHILPLFDWTVDGKRAAQAFHGFLTWGQQTEPLLPYLLPLYDKAFSHISEFGRVRDKFIEPSKKWLARPVYVGIYGKGSTDMGSLRAAVSARVYRGGTDCCVAKLD